MVRRYETVVVMGSEVGEPQVKEEIKKIEGFLQSQGANELRTERWGLKEVGHRMRKKITGNYVCFTYQTENMSLQDALTGALRISDKVMKFQSHYLNPKVRKFKGSVRKAASTGAEGEDAVEGNEPDFLPAQ